MARRIEVQKEIFSPFDLCRDKCGALVGGHGGIRRSKISITWSNLSIARKASMLGY
jgi:hypothetical protein